MWLTAVARYASLTPSQTGERRGVSMSMKSRSLAGGLACLLAAATAIPSLAQNVQRPRHHAPRYTRPYIEIRPQRLLYRRCVDWLELQHRPSGTALFPQYRCWWVTG